MNPITVAAERPLDWLARAILDFKSAPLASLFYGLCFALLAYFLGSYFVNNPKWSILILPLCLLLGPFLAIGLYDLAWQFDQHTPVKFLHSMVAWKKNLPGYTLYAVLLMLIVLAWMRFSFLLFALFADESIDFANQQALWFWLQEKDQWLLLFLGGLVTLIVGFLVFALSAFSIPMMLSEDIDTFSAMQASFQAVCANWKAMFVWFLLIISLTAIGFLSGYLGLVIVMPLLAFATWNGYCEIMGKSCS